MMSNAPVPQLIRHTKKSYGESFNADLFEQYKLYVESAEKISERRVAANNYLLTVNAFLVTLYGLVAASRFNTFCTILVPMAGFLVALTWHRVITSYRDLNTVKFKVIHELEQHMPAALYEYEWRKAEEGRGKAYHPLSHLERWVPIIFMALYALLATLSALGFVQ
ncbi:small integral membrane protein [mine drainage metagenome]|uniref:Small integral membrane protein n=1 Tax=mine drainage metagenome TaxID=410659 RepID=T1C468_9ZZZZ